MKRKKCLILLIAILLINVACGDEFKKGQKTYKVQNPQSYNYSLTKSNTLEYDNNSSKFIGRIKDVTFWNKNIIITDDVFKNIWVFTDKLSFIKIFGRKGDGPGEFKSVPLLILKDSSIALYDFKNFRATLLNSSFELLKTTQITQKKILKLATPIFFNNRYVFAGGGTSSRIEELFNNGSLLILDEKFNYLDEILKYDVEYQKGNAFIAHSDLTHLANVGNESFFAFQSAARKIFKINAEYQIEDILEISPLYYKTPPNDDLGTVNRSLETIADFYSKFSFFRKIDYDVLTGHLYIYYVNYQKEMVTERNWFRGEHYLMILDKEYNSILDEKIDGIFSFVENGNIYILTEENPEGIKIDVYKLAEVEN